MLLTDTHTHLYYETDEEKLDQLMQRCFDNQIERLFLPNVDVASIAKIDALVKKYPNNCFAMAGLHPCDVKENYEEVLDEICERMVDRDIYAIGEIGIDLHWDKSTLPFQQAAFREQIKWAKDMELPIVIHCREAFDEIFGILEEEKGKDLRGILHCFTGNLEQANKAIELGFYLGIGGVVTYKNSGLDEVLKQVPLAKLVLETDSPYLAPVPYRGKPNESSYLVHVAEKLAEIYETSVEEIAAVTTANSISIFKI
ncbi:TatD family deoxyribonuclease [Pedobacter hiemivivus]|uniref:TatD family deoxyribonuclease n=1 Tax=Pedobacter hiemivivus TaxID=2530454 RepID=A0A4U1GBB4_9SPHI|nr:TatD family hydrolase [Pedobacter hiemivivus]TKC61068.1 TatD family deoxyribonuclease [Pedobacter hiemivivus]